MRPRTMCWSVPQMLVVTIFRMTPCSHLRDPRASSGKGIDWTSTLPVPCTLRLDWLPYLSSRPGAALLQPTWALQA